jgi:hypothetical protein
MTLRILTQSERSAARSADERPPVPSGNLLNAANRITFEIDRGFKVALNTFFTDSSQKVNDVDIALSQELWDAGELIKLYHAHLWIASLIAVVENILSLCEPFSEDVNSAELRLEELKKQLTDEIFYISKAARKGKPVITVCLKECAALARPLKKLTVKNRFTARISAAAAEEALFELRHIHQSLVYRIEDNKKFLENRAVMKENYLAFNSQRKTAPSDLDFFSKIFLENIKKLEAIEAAFIKNRSAKV